MKRIRLYLLLFGLLPLLPALSSLQRSRREVGQLQEQLMQTRSSLAALQTKQAANSATREQHAEVDHYYIDHQLETLRFLEAETAQLQQLAEDEPSAPNRELADRILFNQGLENRLRFHEEGVDRQPGFTECVERLDHPVQLGSGDLTTLLTRIEGEVAEKPQLFITFFDLSRKKGYCDNEVYCVDLKMKKREFK